MPNLNLKDEEKLYLGHTNLMFCFTSTAGHFSGKVIYKCKLVGVVVDHVLSIGDVISRARAVAEASMCASCGRSCMAG